MLLLQRALLDSSLLQALSKGNSWRLIINPHKTKEERRNKSEAKHSVKKKKKSLTTENVSFGLQTTPEI